MLQNDFAWSWSRERTFKYCPRMFYWQHYGYWAGWELDAPEDARLANRLKRITTVSALIGSAFHDAVSKGLRERNQDRDVVPFQQLQDEIEASVLERLRESRDRDWERFGNPKRYAILFEDYYGPGVSQRQQDDAVAAIRECVKGFASSPYARRAFATPKDRLRMIDPKDFDAKKIVVDGTTIFAGPDLVVEARNGTQHIVDWKTGKPEKAEAAQLAIYGLYVSEKVGVPLERVVAHLVYVRSGETYTYDHLRESVAEALRRIATFTTDVQSRLTNVERNVAADASRFPMTEDLTKCRRCKFRELCGRMDAPPETPTEAEETSEV